MLVMDRWQRDKLERVMHGNVAGGFAPGELFSKVTITKPAGLTISNKIRLERNGKI